MLLLCALLAWAACDNMQLGRDSFTKVVVGGTAYHSKDLRSGSMLKISYPGYLVYALDEYRPGHFRLVDRTVYLGGAKAGDLLVVVDEVLRPLGVPYEVVKMALVIANLVVLVQPLLSAYCAGPQLHMVEKTSESNLKGAQEKAASVPEIKFLRNKMNENITKSIRDIVASFKGDVVGTTFPNFIKSALDKNFGEGWNVFSGKHFSGVCRYMEGHFAEFEVGDGNIVVVFKSYMPKK
ncbi:UNVERIFIED_CONTAM: hypothetical protein PYX00_011241 [Menopon gallinae]|uniref:Uncharacterized protein n=1 Tax=Menopon gallinae TaxID=328185 RepID=A0AAW2H6G5_9NEOP